jgi:hypothetical protein
LPIGIIGDFPEWASTETSSADVAKGAENLLASGLKGAVELLNHATAREPI